ncbi:MAG: hypothetical protein JXR03_17540 [Cyclobacteriaceae bacterium]
MDINRLNTLIKKVRTINTHINERQQNPYLAKELQDNLMEIKLQYGSFLLDKLFDIYDDYFSDSQMKSIEEYFSGDGVEVEGDDFAEIHALLSIKPYPLRFELEGANHTFKEVIWSAA